MIGMSATTGKVIKGTAHLSQRVWKILSTPLASRVRRRTFGSLLAKLIDEPINRAMPMKLRAATAMALAEWMPSFSLTRVTLSGTPATGKLVVGVEGKDTTSATPNQIISLSASLDLRRAAAS